MENETIPSIIIIILATFSCISCICVCVSIYNKGYTPCGCRKKHINMEEYLAQINQVNIILFWMCIIDGLYMLPIIANWIPQIVPKNNLYTIYWNWNNTQCTIIGVVAQFCGINGAAWHMLLACYLGYILCGGDLQQKIKTIHFVLVNIIPLIGTMIPFFIATKTGYHINIVDGHKDCWLIGLSQYIFIIAIIIALISHCSVLIISCIQRKKSNYKRYQIIFKLSKFVIIYTIIRFFPVIEAIYEISGVIPYWLLLAQHLSIALLGMGNALVWFWSCNGHKNKDKTKLKKEMKQTVYLSVHSVNTETPIHSKTSQLVFDSIRNIYDYDQYNMLESKNEHFVSSNSSSNVSNEKQMDKETNVYNIKPNIYSNI